MKAPDMCGTWVSRGINAWYTGSSLDHYQCNHYFVPKTRANHISGFMELFPPHCQVPFLMWNKHLQEVFHNVTRNACGESILCPAWHQIKIGTHQPYLQTNTHVFNAQMDVTPRWPSKGACYSPHETKGGTKGGQCHPSQHNPASHGCSSNHDSP